LKDLIGHFTDVTGEPQTVEFLLNLQLFGNPWCLNDGAQAKELLNVNQEFHLILIMDGEVRMCCLQKCLQKHSCLDSHPCNIFLVHQAFHFAPL